MFIISYRAIKSSLFYSGYTRIELVNNELQVLEVQRVGKGLTEFQHAMQRKAGVISG